INIIFGVEELSSLENWKLVVDLADSSPKGSLLKISINDQHEKYKLKGVSDSSITGTLASNSERIIKIPLKKGTIRKGGNKVTLTVLEGSWVVFDHVFMEAPRGTGLKRNEEIYIRSVDAADYEIEKE